MRGIAIVGVIFLHSNFQSRFDSQTLALCEILAIWFDWAVLAFFFLSGLLLDEKQGSVWFLKKRFHSLVIPFLFYNLFYNIAFGVMEALTGKDFVDYQQGFSAIWLSFLSSPAFQLYFLPYLFIILVGAFYLCKLIEERWHGWLLIIGFAVMVAFYQRLGWPEDSHGPEWIKLPLYSVALLSGVVGRTVLYKKNISVVIAFLLICIFLTTHQLCLRSLLIPPLLYLAVSFIHFLRESKLLQEIGRSSGAIYLWHTPIMLPAFTTILAFCQVPAMMNLAMSLILTVSVCILFRRGITQLSIKFLEIKVHRGLIP